MYEAIHALLCARGMVECIRNLWPCIALARDRSWVCFAATLNWIWSIYIDVGGGEQTLGEWEACLGWLAVTAAATAKFMSVLCEGGVISAKVDVRDEAG